MSRSFPLYSFPGAEDVTITYNQDIEGPLEIVEISEEYEVVEIES